MMARPRFSSSRLAFTLVELLTVIVIVAILAVVTLPSLSGTLNGFQITGAADLASAEMNLARQTAMSRNLPVELRLYQYDDGDGLAYRVIASVIPASVSGRSSDEWIGSPKMLPGSVVMDDTGGFSTILSDAVTSLPSTSPSTPWKATEAVDAPKLVSGKSYVAFSYRSDGSTNLSASSPWNIALKGMRGKPGATGTPAANYISLVVAPLTGRVVTFQP